MAVFIKASERKVSDLNSPTFLIVYSDERMEIFSSLASREEMTSDGTERVRMGAMTREPGEINPEEKYERVSVEMPFAMGMTSIRNIMS